LDDGVHGDRIVFGNSYLEKFKAVAKKKSNKQTNIKLEKHTAGNVHLPFVSLNQQLHGFRPSFDHLVGSKPIRKVRDSYQMRNFEHLKNIYST